MPPGQPTEQFVRLVSGHQGRLYAWILSLLGKSDDVQDVLQDVNVIIWQKADDYAEGTDFWRWVSQIAYFTVLTYRKRRGRDRLVFDDALLETLSAEATQETKSTNTDLDTLRECMELLPRLDLDLIRERYAQGSSVKQLAETRGKSPGAIAYTLFRIRGDLADCIERNRKHES